MLKFRERRQMRRDLGLMKEGLRDKIVALKERGEWDPDDLGLMALVIVDTAVRSNPIAQAKPGFDWDSFLAFIEMILPFIMLIFGL